MTNKREDREALIEAFKSKASEWDSYDFDPDWDYSPEAAILADIALAVFEQALGEATSTPTDDERARVIAELRWLADARKEYETDTFPQIAREAQTARQLADILERKTPVSDGGQGFGWIPSWRWNEWDDMAALHHPVQGEPEHSESCGERCNHCSICGEDILYGSRCPEHYLNQPQGEPTDAQVLAALNTFAPWSAECHLSDWAEGNVIPMRAALRAAAAVQGGENR